MKTNIPAMKGTVPLNIAFSVVKSRNIREFKLYLAMKYVSQDGVFRPTDKEMEALIMVVAGIKDARTYNKYFLWLLEHSWIKYQRHNTEVRIISYRKLRNSIVEKGHQISSTAVHLGLPDFKQFEGYCYTLAITFCMKFIRNNSNNTGRCQGVYIGRSAKNDIPVLFDPKGVNYARMPINYLAKSLSISPTTAQTYLTIAQKSGYLKRTEVSLRISEEHLDELTQQVMWNHIPPKSVFRKNGVAHKRAPSHLELLIVMKRKRNLLRLKPKKSRTPIMMMHSAGD